MPLEERLEAYQIAYKKAVEEMPERTKTIILWSNIKEMNAKERRGFEDALELLVESVEDWVCTFTLFGQTGFYSHCAINPRTITESSLNKIFSNLLGCPDSLRIEYYR